MAHSFFNVLSRCVTQDAVIITRPILQLFKTIEIEKLIKKKEELEMYGDAPTGDA